MVWDYVLTPEEQIVLLAFADHADHNGEHAWPSIPLLAWKTGLSERTIYRVIRGEKAQLARGGRGVLSFQCDGVLHSLRERGHSFWIPQRRRGVRAACEVPEGCHSRRRFR